MSAVRNFWRRFRHWLTCRANSRSLRPDEPNWYATPWTVTCNDCGYVERHYGGRLLSASPARSPRLTREET